MLGGQHTLGTLLWGPLLPSCRGPMQHMATAALFSAARPGRATSTARLPSPPLMNGTINHSLLPWSPGYSSARGTGDGCAATAQYGQHLSWAALCQQPCPSPTISVKPAGSCLPILHSSMGELWGDAEPTLGGARVPASSIPPG